VSDKRYDEHHDSDHGKRDSSTLSTGWSGQGAVPPETENNVAERCRPSTGTGPQKISTQPAQPAEHAILELSKSTF
jgi:hypothetical protein